MVQIPPQTISEFSTRLRRAVSDIQARAKTNASDTNYQQLFPRTLPYSCKKLTFQYQEIQDDTCAVSYVSTRRHMQLILLYACQGCVGQSTHRDIRLTCLSHVSVLIFLKADTTSNGLGSSPPHKQGPVALFSSLAYES